jgi:hypothetical protein
MAWLKDGPMYGLTDDESLHIALQIERTFQLVSTMHIFSRRETVGERPNSQFVPECSHLIENWLLSSLQSITRCSSKFSALPLQTE